jgi:membrane protease YdiL (CAAX protease family)
MGIFNPDSRLFSLARQSQRLPSGLAAIAIALVILEVALIAGQIPARIVFLTANGVPRWSTGVRDIAEPIVLNITIFGTMFLGLWFWLRFWSKRPFWTLGWERKRTLQRVGRGMLVAGLMLAGTAGLAIVPGASFAPGRLQTMGVAALGISFFSLLSYFVQGPAEEALFRGWLLQVIGARYRPWIGVLVCCVVFSLVHARPGFGFLGFVNLFLFGLFACLYALAEGGLWGIGAWHAFGNWMQGDFFGLSSLGTTHTGLLTSLRPSGPDIITGGNFGLEGGLVYTAALLMAIGFFAMRNRLMRLLAV